MISSMTGYGRAETIVNGAKVTVEISSVNNRFCEIQCRLPKFATDLEPKVKELILSQISRGKIYYNLNWEETSVTNLVKLNEEAAEIYFKIIKELKEKYKLKGSVEVEDILTLPNLIKFEREEIDPVKVWGLISEATLKALSQLKQMRQKEGDQLAQDLKLRSLSLEKIVREIEELSVKSVEGYRIRLKNRISELLTEKIVDQQRLALEVALMAERSDITEECVRFKSHNQQFLATLNQDGSQGKKLGFILQEMHREINSVGAKTQEAQIAQKVIALKEKKRLLLKITSSIPMGCLLLDY